jgi:hypothetical protein
MNKMELIDVMADKAGITKKDAEKALNAFIAITEETLKSGNKVLQWIKSVSLIYASLAYVHPDASGSIHLYSDSLHSG